jgi:4-amino-4-deoxy-L-arabinose transferase-like glycosyltransferase
MKVSIPAPFIPLALVVVASLAVDFSLFVWKRRNWRERGASDMGDWLLAWLTARLPLASWGRRLGFLGQAWQRVSKAWDKRKPQAVPLETPATLSTQAAPPEPEALSRAPELTSGPEPGMTEALSPSALEPSPANQELAMTSSPSIAVAPVAPADTPASSPDRQPEAPASGRMARVQISVELPEGTGVRITVEALPGMGITVNHQPLLPAVLPSAPLATPVAPGPARSSLPAVAALPQAAGAAPSARLAEGRERLKTVWSQVRTFRVWQWAAALPLAMVLFGLGLAVYLITRLVGLDRYPIYFFTDEAVHTVLVADFVRNGFQNSYHEFLPTYFSLGSSFGLNGVSVYLQLLPYLLFGKSVFVTRATSVFITLLGTGAVALALRDVFKVRYWWTAVLLLTITPAWFLHSRTAFENAEVAAFYGMFIYFYLRYRCGSPRWLYGAVVAGALTFYTHGLGEMLILATAGLLFVIDLPYHFKNRAIVGRGLLLTVLLALPYARYSLAHSSEFMAELHQRGSYWTNESLSLGAKLSNFASEYAYGLNPMYWYFPEDRDIARHVMNGYGNILWPTLPFALLGLVQIIRNFRQAAYRVILVTLLTTPIGSALVAIGVPRMLWFLMPSTMLTVLGLSAVMEWLEQRRWPARALSLSLFAVLTGFSFYMLYDALTHGPTWSKDYTLYGMQYGAEQLFGEAIPSDLARDPNVRFEVSPAWANGTDLFIPFFLSPSQQARVQLRNIDYYLSDKQTIDPNVIQVMTPEEYDRAIQSGKFKDIKIEQTLPYPDGRTGFYFTRLTYADNVDQTFAAEAETRRQLLKAQIRLGDQRVTVQYSQIGDMTIESIFDGDRDTLVRGTEANPFVLEFDFPEPRPVTGIVADFGSMDFTLTAQLYAPGSDTPVKQSQTYRDQPPDPHVEMKLENAPALVSKLRVEILSLLAGKTANIHIREFHVQP